MTAPGEEEAEGARIVVNTVNGPVLGDVVQVGDVQGDLIFGTPEED